MVNFALVYKEWRENRWKYVVSLGYLGLVAAILPFLQDWTAKMLESLGVSLPGPLGEALTRQLEDYRLFVWANWYGKNFYQAVPVISILLGMSAVAGETSRGTSILLFSRPLARENIYRAKYLAGATGLLAVMVLSTATIYISSILAKESPGLSFFAGLPLTFAGGLVVYSLAVASSVLFHDQVKAGMAAAGMALAISIPGWIPAISSLSIYRHMTAWPVFLGRGYPWEPLAVMLAASLIIHLAGQYWLKKKDF